MLGASGLKLVFVLFQSSEVSVEEVEREAEEQGDVLLGDRVESYRGLVYKHLMAIRWAHNNCHQVKHVIKMDDDIFVDFPKLLEVVAKSSPSGGRYMSGLLHLSLPVLRRGKWGVAEDEVEGNTYPDFLSGWCYVTSPQVLASMLEVLEHHQPQVFWIDDVWVTGVLAAMAEVQLISLNMYYTVYTEHLQCCVDQPDLTCPYMVGPTDASPNLTTLLAKHSQRCRAGGCRERLLEEGMARTCHVDNPLFLPLGPGHGEVLPV